MPTEKKILKSPYPLRLLNPRDMDADQRRDAVFAAFLRGLPVEEGERFYDRVGDGRNGGRGWSGSGPLWTRRGTPRVCYDKNGVLYSYGVNGMALAFRTTYEGKPFVIINADGSPTKNTSKHQWGFRDVLDKGHTVDKGKSSWSYKDDENGKYTYIRPRLVDPSPVLPKAFIPFSVLRTARIDLEDVKVVATTPDTEVRRVVPDREKGGTKVIRIHFLGETLFRDANTGRLFVCGLDRNDDPSARMFYLAQIPEGADPKTVDEALASLRPAGLPKNTKRQGEWFLVPEARYAAPKAEILKKVPIVSDKPAEQNDAVEIAAREKRHVASQMHLNGSVRVRGRILDDEHDTLKLGDVWHRVVKNLAPRGWRYDHSNDKVKVD